MNADREINQDLRKDLILSIPIINGPHAGSRVEPGTVTLQDPYDTDKQVHYMYDSIVEGYLVTDCPERALSRIGELEDEIEDLKIAISELENGN